MCSVYSTSLILLPLPHLFLLQTLTSCEMSSPEIAIGIDLGTSNSCVGVVRNGQVDIIPNEQGDRLTPSFVAFTQNEILVGDSAKYQHSMNPENTIYEVKRLIGRKFTEEHVKRDVEKLTYKVTNNEGNPEILVDYRGAQRIFTPEDISAIILGRLKEIAETYLGCKVQKAVISVPAYFTDSQRQATMDAGDIAGLDVLKIINEPTAAAIAYGEDTNVSKETNILVFDFGGGTFDVAVLIMKKGNYEVKAVKGNSHLGGGDLDTRLIELMVEEFKGKTSIDISQDSKALAKIKTAAEKAKIALSTSLKHRIEIECVSQGQDLNLGLMRCKFELLCEDLFDQTLRCIDEALKDAGMTTNDIHDVVLVGGSSRIPKLKEMLTQKFPGKNIKGTISPAEAVAYGAAVHAAMLNNDDTVEDIQLSDVIPQSLGVFVHGNIMSTIIKRNTKIPAKCAGNYTTVTDYQKLIHFQVFEGENPIATKNHLLGEFYAEGIEIAKKNVPSVEVTFQLDNNGILNATALDRKTGGGGRVTISVKKGRLVKEDIDRKMTEMREIRELENKYRALVDASAALEATILQKKSILERKRNSRRISQQGYELISRVCEEAQGWLDSHDDSTKAEFDHKEQEFNESFYSLLSEWSIKM